MNHGWPAKNIRLQPPVEGRSLSRCEAMHGICEQACGVANAAGAAIALVKSNELIYEAGSGSSTGYVGRRMMATFTASASDQAVTEILRVQDAETDSRIQSAICRQFGARSLLILPLSSGGILSGILQISFDQAHEFLGAEVEAYRALARLAEQVMTASSQRGAAEIGVAANLPHEALIPETAPFPWSNESTALWSRTRFLSRFGHAWDVAVSAVILIAAFGLILSRDGATTSLPLAASPAPGPVKQQAAGSLATSQTPPLRSVENGIPSDQHRRHQRSSHPTGQIQYFGDDVTVRYFAPETAAVRTREDVEVRQVSDDVTVRYFSSGGVEKR